jgi:hypothetical protein
MEILRNSVLMYNSITFPDSLIHYCRKIGFPRISPDFRSFPLFFHYFSEKKESHPLLGYVYMGYDGVLYFIFLLIGMVYLLSFRLRITGRYIDFV